MLSGNRIFRIGTRVSRNRIVACALLVLLLASVSLATVRGADNDENPVAIGFVGADGATSIVESTIRESAEGLVSYSTGAGVPAEPLGHSLVRLTNQKRTTRGLPPLKAAWELMDSAQFHSDWMADHDCFAHTCSGETGWVTRIENAGYLNHSYLGENIAAGYTSSSAVIEAWMDSPGHRDNMLSVDFREAGGAYAFSGSAYYYHYWTLDLGARNDAQGNAFYPVVIDEEAWSTTSLSVDLYVYGQGWATEMRFRNEGETWSPWESFSCEKTWRLSAGGGSPATVYAQIKRGATVLESSDSIHLDMPLRVVPDSVVFLSAQGSTPTVPAQYKVTIDTWADWTASADEGWIRLSDAAGSGPSTLLVHLEGFPTVVGRHTGMITVEALGTSDEVWVTLVVTSGSLVQSHVPLTTRDQG
jgi:uncharacterized protein YkwD